MSRVEQSPQVTVILPCLDEAASIEKCVTEAFEGLQRAEVCGEVLVVDNGSTDGSAELATASGARVVCEDRPGYGAALQRGIDEARGAIGVMADADMTYDLSRLGELVRAVEDGADLVLANRLDGASRTTMPPLHRLIGTPVISFLVRHATSGELTVHDSQSGYRAFDVDAVRGLQLQTDGMEFASEMLIRAADHRLAIEEVSIPYRERVGDSKLNTFDDGFRHLKLVGLLAPKVVLLWPGVASVLLGLALSVASLVQPDGIGIGSTSWQPIFFGPIAFVLGSMLLASYLVVSVASPLAPGRTRSEHTALRRRLGGWGVAMAAAGVAIDGVLFARHLSGASGDGRPLALAGLAQSLILSGAVALTSAFLHWLLQHQQRYSERLR